MRRIEMRVIKETDTEIYENKILEAQRELDIIGSNFDTENDIKWAIFIGTAKDISGLPKWKKKMEEKNGRKRRMGNC